MKEYTWETIKAHRDPKCSVKLIVINGKVYNITNFMHKHPGGAKVIASYSGEDATDVWTALHNDRALVEKYMAPLQCGVVTDYESEVSDLQRDFRSLRAEAEAAGWFKARPLFFLAHLAQCWLLELAAILILWQFGTSAASVAAACVCMCVSQAQAGWAQHDYGHLCVFNARAANRFMHEFIIGHFKGASSHWWNFRHFMHHSKTNVHGSDPDVTLPQLFLLGDKIPKEWGRRRRGVMPYNWQHSYFWLLGPPLLLPLYFHFENVYFVLKRRGWRDMWWAASFFFKFFFIFNHFFPTCLHTMAFYFCIRFLESHWFVACTQMSHIAMEIGRDSRRDWVSMQVGATQNATHGPFTDWFTGHLNFQIEHHLFPTMPRHSFHKVQPLVQALCRRHGLVYTQKSIGCAMWDIYRALKKSGQLWFEAYHMPG